MSFDDNVIQRESYLAFTFAFFQKREQKMLPSYLMYQKQVFSLDKTNMLCL